MVGFVESKEPDLEFVAEALQASRDENRWTNFGPVSRRLEARIEELLELPAGSRAVATASGTVAIYALVGLYGFLAQRPLRWVVSAFTFACQRQGPLADSLVVDCGNDGFLDADAVERIPSAAYDGIIVTNLFGGAANIARWTELANRLGKRLVFDSASGFLSDDGCSPLGRFGDGEAFSFHHTKPMGMGEGGCAIVPSQHEATLRSLINLGRYAGIDTGRFSMNGKLSDVAAAFILDRLRSPDEVRAHHRRQWQRVTDAAMSHGFQLVGDPRPSFPSLAALLAPQPVSAAAMEGNAVTLHKLYPPLVDDASVANQIFERVVCWPTHVGLADVDDRELHGMLRRLAASPR